jgi:hypothetical protein
MHPEGYKLASSSFRSLQLVLFAEQLRLSSHAVMAPKYHPTPVSGSHRKALAKALTRSRAMTLILGRRAAETRAAGEAMIREPDDLLCQSWNERMWADGELRPLAYGRSGDQWWLSVA